MKNNRIAAKSTNAWEHWAWIWSVVFVGSLLLPLLILYRERALTNREWQSALMLTAAALLVHGVAFWGMPRWGAHLGARTHYSLIYIALLGALIAGLLAIHPTFYFVLSGLFTQIFFSLAPRAAIPVAMGTSVLLGVLARQGQPALEILADPIFWLWMLAGVTGSLIALWLTAIIDQSAQRQSLIEELHKAQADLARVGREAGILQERQRLAREIHDTIAQDLISIISHLEAADQVLESGAGSLRHHLTQAQRAARSSLGEARRVVHDLRPEALEDSTLPDAVRRVVAGWSQSSGIAAAGYVSGDARPLSTEMEVTLLRIVQESLANVAKHANARGVSVTLSYLPDRVLLDVQDDGDGLQATATDPLFSAGFGMHSMRQRVANLGGTLQIESEPGQGATLVVDLPVVPDQSAAAPAMERDAPHVSVTPARDALPAEGER